MKRGRGWLLWLLGLTQDEPPRHGERQEGIKPPGTLGELYKTLAFWRLGGELHTILRKSGFLNIWGMSLLAGGGAGVRRDSCVCGRW